MHSSRVATSSISASEAIELLEGRVNENSDDWALHGRLAALLALEGRHQEALQHFGDRIIEGSVLFEVDA